MLYVYQFHQAGVQGTGVEPVIFCFWNRHVYLFHQPCIPRMGVEPIDPAPLMRCIFQFCYRGISVSHKRTYPRTDSDRHSCGLKPHASTIWTTGAWFYTGYRVVIAVVTCFFPFFYLFIPLYLISSCVPVQEEIYFVIKARCGTWTRTPGLEDRNATNHTDRAFGERSACFCSPIWF